MNRNVYLMSLLASWMIEWPIDWPAGRMAGQLERLLIARSWTKPPSAWCFQSAISLRLNCVFVGPCTLLVVLVSASWLTLTTIKFVFILREQRTVPLRLAGRGGEPNKCSVNKESFVSLSVRGSGSFTRRAWHGGNLVENTKASYVFSTLTGINE